MSIVISVVIVVGRTSSIAVMSFTQCYYLLVLYNLGRLLVGLTVSRYHLYPITSSLFGPEECLIGCLEPFV